MTSSVRKTSFTTGLGIYQGKVCYEGVIVTYYNQVKTLCRKRKEKYSRNSFSFLFARGSEFLYSWKRVKLQLDLACYDNTMEKPRCDVNRSCGMFSAAYYRVDRVM
jgi:hypothetical protein